MSKGLTPLFLEISLEEGKKGWDEGAPESLHEGPWVRMDQSGFSAALVRSLDHHHIRLFETKAQNIWAAPRGLWHSSRALPCVGPPAGLGCTWGGGAEEFGELQSQEVYKATGWTD